MSLTFVHSVLISIATFIKHQVLRLVRKSTYIGLAVDEATRHGRMQLLSFYRLHVGGSPKVVFAGIDQMPNGEAITVTATCRHRLDKDGIPIEQLGSFGSDGASPMAGAKNGCAMRLVRDNPMIVPIHCVCHREALASRDAANAVPYLTHNFFPTIEQLGRYYDFSAKRVANLEAIQLVLLGFIIKIVKSAFTRWLTHDDVTCVLVQTLIPVLLELRAARSGRDPHRTHNVVSKGDATAAGLFSVMCSYEFLCFLALSRDVLPSLARLNAMWQAVSTDVEKVQVPLNMFSP